MKSKKGGVPPKEPQWNQVIENLTEALLSPELTPSEAGRRLAAAKSIALETGINLQAAYRHVLRSKK